MLDFKNSNQQRVDSGSYPFIAPGKYQEKRRKIKDSLTKGDEMCKIFR